VARGLDGFGFWQLASLMTRSRLFHFRGEDDLWAFWDLFQAAEDKAPAIVILEDLNRIFGGDGTAKCDHRLLRHIRSPIFTGLTPGRQYF